MVTIKLVKEGRYDDVRAIMTATKGTQLRPVEYADSFPAVGDELYLPSDGLDRDWNPMGLAPTEVCGGRATVSCVTHEFGICWVEVRELPERKYNWKILSKQQLELQKIFGKDPPSAYSILLQIPTRRVDVRYEGENIIIEDVVVNPDGTEEIVETDTIKLNPDSETNVILQSSSREDS